MGRKKIDIAPIDSNKIRHATFSKRKVGLMKKAIELSVLCNCQVVVLVYDRNQYHQYCSDPQKGVQDMLEHYRQWEGECHQITNEDLPELKPGKASSLKAGTTFRKEKPKLGKKRSRSRSSTRSRTRSRSGKRNRTRTSLRSRSRTSSKKEQVHFSSPERERHLPQIPKASKNVYTVEKVPSQRSKRSRRVSQRSESSAFSRNLSLNLSPTRLPVSLPSNSPATGPSPFYPYHPYPHPHHHSHHHQHQHREYIAPVTYLPFSRWTAQHVPGEQHAPMQPQPLQPTGPLSVHTHRSASHHPMYPQQHQQMVAAPSFTELMHPLTPNLDHSSQGSLHDDHRHHHHHHHQDSLSEESSLSNSLSHT